MSASKAALLKIGVAIGAIAVSAPAWGQQAPPAVTDGEQAGIEDIVVTAQRRAENLQKSSVPIEVLSSEDLARAGVSRVADLAAAVPGVQIGQGGAATQIYIRGVGDFGSTSLTNPAVAFNVDGVYVARPAGLEGNFHDIERVEILKGPQGTLYGRNATGGAINVITNKPRLGVRELSGASEAGNYSKMLAEAAVNLPLGDTLAVRVAGQLVHRGPYSTNNYNDDIHQSVRGQLLFEPDDALSIRVGADYTHVGGGGTDFVPLPRIPGTSPWMNVTDPASVDRYLALAAAQPGRCFPRGFPGAPTSPGNLSTFVGQCAPLVVPGGPFAGTYQQTSFVRPAADEQGRTNNEFYSVFGQLDYDFGPVVLTILPAYRHASLDYVTHPGLGTRYDISAGGVPETSKATSLETRLSHESDRLKAVLGFYYFDEKQRGVANVTSGLIQDSLGFQNIDTRSYAGFGQATFGLTDTLRVIGGLRYTSDRRRSDSETYNVAFSPFNPDGTIGFYAAVAAGACTPGPVPGVTGFIGCLSSAHGNQLKTTKWNWKAGVEFDLAPDNMLFATASTGLKAGGLSTGQKAPGVTNTYLPEDLLAFEIGSRNRFFDNKLQVNLEGFYYDYKNHQEAVIALDSIGNPAQQIFNAGEGRAYGANVDVVFKPSRNDIFHVGVEYLNSKYTTFIFDARYSAASGPFFAPSGTGCALTTDAVNLVQTVDCSGFPFTRAPKWTGVVSYAHTFELGGGGGLTAEANMQFQSSRYLGPEYTDVALVGANQVYNASLTYEAPDGNWSLQAYVRNIGKEAVYTASIPASFVRSFAVASISAPRTYGARLSFKF